MTEAAKARAAWMVRQVLKGWSAERLIQSIGTRRSLHHEIGVGLLFRDPSDPETAHVPPGHAEVYVPGAQDRAEEAIVPDALVIALLIERLGEVGSPEDVAQVQAWRQHETS